MGLTGHPTPDLIDIKGMDGIQAMLADLADHGRQEFLVKETHIQIRGKGLHVNHTVETERGDDDPVPQVKAVH